MTLFRRALLIVCAAGLFGAPVVADQLIGARRPCPSPDGSLVAFDYQGDIWVAPMSGGRPQRITANDAYDYGPVFSPDGAYVAFNSDREGNADVYVIATLGGLERRVTYHSAHDHVLDWNAEGDAVVFGSYRYALEGAVYEVELAGGFPQPIIHQYAREATLGPGGLHIAVSFNANPWWRKHYQGSGGGELWIKDLENGSWQRLTTTRVDERFPSWSATGDSIFFVAEVDSIPNLHSLEIATGEVSVLTRLSTFGTRFPRSSRNGIICYESGRRLFALHPPYTEPKEIIIQAESGCRGTAVQFVEQATLSGFALSHSGEELAVVSRGQLVGFPVAQDDELLSPRFLVSGPLRTQHPAFSPEDDRLVYTSDRTGSWNVYVLEPGAKDTPFVLADRWHERQLTASIDSDRQPAFSPDGSRIAFIRNERQLCVVDSEKGEITILHDGATITRFAWSPDSRYIAFSKTTLEWREDIFIVPAEGGPVLQVTRHPNDDYQPLWEPGGRWLFFASRTADGEYALKMAFLTQEQFEKTREDRLLEEMQSAADSDKQHDENDGPDEPVSVSIDEKDIYRRVKTITTVRGQYYPYAMSPNGERLAFKAETHDGKDLYVVDVWDDKKTPITQGGENPEEFLWGPESNRIYYRTGKGKLFSVNKNGKDKRSLSFKLRLKVDTAAERRQMLDEGWRLLRDGFYDSTMHGVDWDAVRETYSALVDPCATEPEFYNLLREMIGELGASHLGVWRREPGVPGTGEMGIIPDELYRGDGVQVAAVVPRSPAWMQRSRLKVGDVITAIDGQSVSSDESFFGQLQGFAGRRTRLDVVGDDGQRIVMIEPVDRRALRTLLREQWIESNRAVVDSLSKDRVGYLYVRAMGDRDWLRFQRDFLAFNFDKDALIIDVRGNSGGRIHNQIIDMLTARAHSFRKERHGTKTYDPHIRWEKPLVVLIDERSYSDGEIFPSAVKTLSIGTLIGVPTNGSVIGTNDVELLDGTTFRVPRTGWWTIEGHNLENNGVRPDIYVERMPEEHADGRDRQLQRAVLELLKKLG